jgi:hypothetical protein
MTSAELYAALRPVPARVGAIVHLRTAIVDGSRSDAVEDLLEHVEREEIAALWPSMSEDAREAFYDLDQDAMEAWIEELGLVGFLIRVETPIVDKRGGYSWGCYTTKLFYADTYDEAVTAGLAWAKDEHQKLRK